MIMTHYRVNEAAKLGNEAIMISGSVVDGPLLTVGQEGSAVVGGDKIRVVVTGTGVIDPNLNPPGRQGILVAMLEGDEASLKGITLLFSQDSLNQRTNK
jgi:hypothetical protein